MPPPSHRHRKKNVSEKPSVRNDGALLFSKNAQMQIEILTDILISRFHFQFNLIMHPALRFNYLTSGL